MESDIKRAIILDFYGLPGSGKTTKAHEIAERYRSQGMRVSEPSYEYDHRMGRYERKIKKTMAAVKVLVRCPKCFCRLVWIARRNGYGLRNGILNQVINISTKLEAVKKYGRNCDYIVFDEGLAQAAVSLSVNSSLSSKKNLRLILNELDGEFKIMLQKTELDIAEALSRIEQRGTADTRIEKLRSGEEKGQWMMEYKRAVDAIDKNEFDGSSV